MHFLLSASRTTKIVVTILIVFVASSTAAIGHYATTHPSPPNASPIITPSFEPAVSSTPTSTAIATRTPNPSPTTTPTKSPVTTPTPSPISTISPSPTPITTLTLTPTPAPIPIITPSPSSQTMQERVRDSVMSYIRSNHPETIQFMTDLVWTGGRATPPNLVGAETYMYYSQGWNITMSYPMVLNPIYKIVADYSAIGIGIPYRIIWKGTWQNEIINETSFVFAQ